MRAVERVAHRARVLPGFLNHERYALIEALRRRWHRYKEVRGIEGTGWFVHPSAILRRLGPGCIHLGYDARIEDHVLVVIGDGSLTLQDGAVINEFCNVRAFRGDITIGAKTIIAQYVSLIAVNHNVPPRRAPIKEADYETVRRDIVIGDDVWVGSNVVILPGVTIGDGAVIGAGSIVTKSIPPYAIAVGNPARVARYREARQQDASPWEAYPIAGTGQA